MAYTLNYSTGFDTATNTETDSPGAVPDRGEVWYDCLVLVVTTVCSAVWSVVADECCSDARSWP